MAKACIFRTPIPRDITVKMAQDTFEDMVKFVADVKRRVLCAGGELHSDAEQLLLEDGSSQEDLWGGNYYWNDPSEERFEYTSMINLRPGNAAQRIQSEEILRRVRDVAAFFFETST